MPSGGPQAMLERGHQSPGSTCSPPGQGLSPGLWRVAEARFRGALPPAGGCRGRRARRRKPAFVKPGPGPSRGGERGLGRSLDRSMGCSPGSVAGQLREPGRASCPLCGKDSNRAVTLAAWCTRHLRSGRSCSRIRWAPAAVGPAAESSVP